MSQKTRQIRSSVVRTVHSSVDLKDTVCLEKEQGHIFGLRAKLMTDCGTGSYETAIVFCLYISSFDGLTRM